MMLAYEKNKMLPKFTIKVALFKLKTFCFESFFIFVTEKN